MKETLSAEKRLYFELYAFYKQRLKNKRLTEEAFIFEQNSAKELAVAAHNITLGIWEVSGYFPFNVYHPNRVINAPYYIDRVVEQWFVERFIQPVFIPELYEYNMACQKKKGPFLAMDMVSAALEELFYMYGTDFYVYQYDMQGYFDNISHEAAMRIVGKRINPEYQWLYEVIMKSYESKDGYASLNNPSGQYGFPKGNLPSQWTGIILLNELDLKIHNNPECIFNMRYMDDGIQFFHKKEDCKKCDEYVRQYLADEQLGIRLHPVKTYYAPISRGFTFCGWHYTLDENGHVHRKIKNSRKKDMEHRLKVISEEVKKNRMSVFKANTIRDGMFQYLSHGECHDLIKYMKHQYPIPKIKGGNKRKEYAK